MIIKVVCQPTEANEDVLGGHHLYQAHLGAKDSYM